jgi:hypothetical protein
MLYGSFLASENVYLIPHLIPLARVWGQTGVSNLQTLMKGVTIHLLGHLCGGNTAGATATTRW